MTTYRYRKHKTTPPGSYNLAGYFAVIFLKINRVPVKIAVKPFYVLLDMNFFRPKQRIQKEKDLISKRNQVLSLAEKEGFELYPVCETVLHLVIQSSIIRCFMVFLRTFLKLRTTALFRYSGQNCGQNSVARTSPKKGGGGRGYAKLPKRQF